MAKSTYYFLSKEGYVGHIVSPYQYETMYHYYNYLFQQSDTAWCEGPYGGVRVVYNNFWRSHKRHGYITQNAEAMKEFAWNKLRSQPIIK